MNALLIIAICICGLEILYDIIQILQGDGTNLLLHIFYTVIFSIALAVV